MNTEADNLRLRIELLFVLAILLLCRAVHGETGTASWYGEDHRGRLMANGKPFNPDALTCASWFYPFGTMLRVTAGDRSVIVTCTDHGPNKRLHRAIDLSAAAFAVLADRRRGLIEVKIEKI